MGVRFGMSAENVQPRQDCLAREATRDTNPADDLNRFWHPKTSFLPNPRAEFRSFLGDWEHLLLCALLIINLLNLGGTSVLQFHASHRVPAHMAARISTAPHLALRDVARKFGRDAALELHVT